MADAAHHHVPGEMDIHEQAATFHGFIIATKWFCLHLAAVLLMLVLWFCTPAGFFGGLIPGLIVIALGILLLREKKGAAH